MDSRRLSRHVHFCRFTLIFRCYRHTLRFQLFYCVERLLFFNYSNFLRDFDLFQISLYDVKFPYMSIFKKAQQLRKNFFAYSSYDHFLKK